MEEKHVKHFAFDAIDDRRGRFALALVDNDRIRFKRLSGPAPTPGHLLSALAFWPELVDRLNEAVTKRTEVVSVRHRQGWSGCVDYYATAQDPETLDFSVSGEIHVSMNGRLNRPFTLALADFGLLAARLAFEYRPAPVNEIAADWPLRLPWEKVLVKLDVQLDENGEPKLKARRRSWYEKEFVESD